MAGIKLSTYRVIIANEVFGRKAKPIYHHKWGEVEATQVMRIVRFKIPTQKEVIDLIRTSARSIDISSPEKYEPLDSDPKTIYSLKSLPASEIRDIARGKKNSLAHLERHYSNNLQEGRIYLGAFNGIVPNPILDSARELIAQEGTEVYARAIEETGREQWNLRIKLSESRKFPDSLKLECLLDAGVRDSDMLSFQGNFGNYQTVARQARLLCKALSSPETIAQIRDTSPQYLEQLAVSTIRETAEYISKKNILGGIIKMFAYFSEELGEEPPRKSLEDHGFSLN